MAGLFDTFTISKRGLSVQQGNINTSAHNIANASTVGYSRQRAVIETTRPFGGNGKFDSCFPGQIGTGAQIATIQRIRNEFIDFQVRDANGILANSEVKADFLSKVEDILGETSDEGIQGLLTQFYKSLQSLTGASEKPDIKSVVIQNALSLTDSMNYTYNQLKKQLDNAQNLLGDNVVTVNKYLDQINELNKQIRRISSLGQSPNDLMDSRDVLLDELSKKFGINIDKQSLNSIDLNSDEYNNLKLVNADPNDLDFNRFSTVKSASVEGNDTDGYKVKVEYYKLGDKNSAAETVTIDINPTGTQTTNDAKKFANDLKEQLEKCRILIADKEGNVALPDAVTADGRLLKIETLADGRSKQYFVDSKGHYIDKDGNLMKKDSNGDLAHVDKDGNVTTNPDKYVKTTNGTSWKQNIFQTYEYEAGVNNVPTSNDKIKGEIAGNQSVQATIKNYMNDLDKLAASIAYAMNAVQTGSLEEGLTTGNSVSQDLIFVKNGTNTDSGISAATITVNKDLISDSTKLNCKPADKDGNGANDRAQSMASLLTTLKFDFGSVKGNASTWDRKNFLSGTDGVGVKFNSADGADAEKNVNLTGKTTGTTLVSYYASLINKMGSELKAAKNTVSSQETVQMALENQRLSESGVSLDEEMTDLITFQHAYQANAKMISTIDQLLDVVINGLVR